MNNKMILANTTPTSAKHLRLNQKHGVIVENKAVNALKTTYLTVKQAQNLTAK